MLIFSERLHCSSVGLQERQGLRHYHLVVLRAPCLETGKPQ